MKYMMFICIDPDVPGRPGQADDPTIEQWLAEVEGKRSDGNQLQGPADATTVRTRGDEVLLTDGPFVETREFIVGFDILDCADLDEAITIASRHPCARYGAVEVRPFFQD